MVNLRNLTDSKIGKFGEQEIHYSVGAIIEREGKYLLIDRAKPPFGFASLAGHVDSGEEPEDALIREVKEESGLIVKGTSLLAAELITWNECSKGMKGHYWYVYHVDVEGDITQNEDEEKSIGWFGLDEISKLPLEPVWEYWFKKLDIL